ncbi:DUF3027 domain-containing protein [Agromyces sp. LHK192]|uniref:DUF3027 domain-containing protein n=1 Tax=Agromyces sp. LHK192 TaxID=2498704 RepID=UPI000FDC4389|nr:DUF3027 domain-containing protein [Agromyces sp. LHK192]
MPDEEPLVTPPADDGPIADDAPSADDALIPDDAPEADDESTADDESAAAEVAGETRVDAVADEVLLASAALAQRALLETTPPETVGSVIGHIVEDEHVLTLLFAADLAGYRGWHWSVTIARVEGADPTVLETELMPGEQALLAPEWVPWSERLAEYRAAQAQSAALGDGDPADDDEFRDGFDGDRFDEDDADDGLDDGLGDADGYGSDVEEDDDHEHDDHDHDDHDDVFDGIDIDALGDPAEPDVSEVESDASEVESTETADSSAGTSGAAGDQSSED